MKTYRIYWSLPLISDIQAESEDEARAKVKGYTTIDAFHDQDTCCAPEENEIHNVQFK